MENGSDGIPLFGKTEAYATEMWLDDPTAFWLHPEGPLSETTPDEYRAKMAEAERLRLEAGRNRPVNPYANAYSAQSGLAMQYQSMLQAANMQSQYQNHLNGLSQQYQRQSLFGGLFGPF